MNVNVTWLGQGGFLLELDGFRLLIDPYLSDAVEHRSKAKLKRLIPSPLSFAELHPDAIICTHDHLDHYDPDSIPELMRLFPECILAGPESVREKAEADALDMTRFQKLDKGESIKFAPCTVKALPAKHSDPLSIGLRLETSDLNIYFSGDTEYFPELPDAAGKNIDIIFICINGKYGNMTWQEALSIVKAIRPRLTIPMHYGMFAENTIDPDDFIKDCIESGIKAVGLKIGERFLLK